MILTPDGAAVKNDTVGYAETNEVFLYDYNLFNKYLVFKLI